MVKLVEALDNEYILSEEQVSGLIDSLQKFVGGKFDVVDTSLTDRDRNVDIEDLHCSVYVFEYVVDVGFRLNKMSRNTQITTSSCSVKITGNTIDKAIGAVAGETKQLYDVLHKLKDFKYNIYNDIGEYREHDVRVSRELPINTDTVDDTDDGFGGFSNF